MNLINIGIAGCLGRMGRELVLRSIDDKRTDFSSGFENKDHKFINKNLSDIFDCQTNKTVNSDAATVFKSSDVVIDFTTPQSTLNNIELAEKTKTPLVIGTTGLTKEILEKIKNTSLNVPILQSYNMSLAVNLLFNLVEKSSSLLDESNYDIEISETHHKHKVDAPSGTAIKLGEIASSARKKEFDSVKVFDRTKKNQERKNGEIGFSVLRGGEISGEHTISFIGENDRIDLTHKAFNRSIFAKGAIQAAIFLSDKKEGLYSMEDVIKD